MVFVFLRIISHMELGGRVTPGAHCHIPRAVPEQVLWSGGVHCSAGEVTDIRQGCCHEHLCVRGACRWNSRVPCRTSCCNKVIDVVHFARSSYRCWLPCRCTTRNIHVTHDSTSFDLEFVASCVSTIVHGRVFCPRTPTERVLPARRSKSRLLSYRGKNKLPRQPCLPVCTWWTAHLSALHTGTPSPHPTSPISLFFITFTLCLPSSSSSSSSISLPFLSCWERAFFLYSLLVRDHVCVIMKR